MIDYTLSFDLYLLDSWDGGYPGLYGPDFFSVAVNGQSLLHEAMHSVEVQQNFRQPDVGPAHLGYNTRYVDSIYRDVTLQFSLACDVETIRIDFIGQPSSFELDDESWALDNIRLSARAVPTPGTMAGGLLGLALAAPRRRRLR
ncbi:MAG: hypothetical protein Kow0022_13050 [Phycisphaerales bacterium]